MLDAQIRDVLDVFSILLVFVVAYFTAVLVRVEELIELPRPEIGADRRRLERRLKSNEYVLGALGAIALAILSIGTPILLDVFGQVGLHRVYSPLRAGFVVLNVLLCGSVAWIFFLVARLHRRCKELA